MKRLLSLDVFRGMTVALMIMVNNPGNWEFVYPPLKHAKWDGLTPTDLVFPFFLFIVGISTFFSLSKFKFQLNSTTIFKIVKRGVLIYAIGIALSCFGILISSNPDNLSFLERFSNLRLIGVLHRIGIAYMLGAILACSLKSVKKIISATAFLLIGYWIILWIFGGDNFNSPFSLEGNIVKNIDLAIFGENHIYHGYGIPFDPEGLLSSIPAIGTVLLGFLTGKFISSAIMEWKRMFQLQTIGLVLVAFSLITNAWFPINKPLWSSSYVLCSAGLAMIVLSFLIYIIDIMNYKKWTSFFTVFGTNALFIYVFAGIFAITMSAIKVDSGNKVLSLKDFLYHNIYQPNFGDYFGSLMLSITYIIVFWAVGLILYRQKIIIKL